MQNSEEEKRETKCYFFGRSGIPGVIGCIDGTHIKIVSPKKEHQHLYYNRKGFFSLNAMIVCDNAMRIRYINAKYPGATHDANVFNMSALKQQLEEEYRSGERNVLLVPLQIDKSSVPNSSNNSTLILNEYNQTQRDGKEPSTQCSERTPPITKPTSAPVPNHNQDGDSKVKPPRLRDVFFISVLGI
ncbi:putative nuclease HARBI1 [Rhagoletis pomonella]|uniref:putative nuclease HARBI1 n=1 Tax=Rhagoletis pomonella TaxID=28610 RepID=UPI00178347DA|nr:putative nuclease HARBI1 [Rhagoletis pomonella]